MLPVGRTLVDDTKWPATDKQVKCTKCRFFYPNAALLIPSVNAFYRLKKVTEFALRVINYI